MCSVWYTRLLLGLQRIFVLPRLASSCLALLCYAYGRYKMPKDWNSFSFRMMVLVVIDYFEVRSYDSKRLCRLVGE